MCVRRRFCCGIKQESVIGSYSDFFFFFFSSVTCPSVSWYLSHWLWEASSAWYLCYCPPLRPCAILCFTSAPQHFRVKRQQSSTPPINCVTVCEQRWDVLTRPHGDSICLLKYEESFRQIMQLLCFLQLQSYSSLFPVFSVSPSSQTISDASSSPLLHTLQFTFAHVSHFLTVAAMLFLKLCSGHQSDGQAEYCPPDMRRHVF